MWNGTVIEVAEQTIVVANSEFLYINSSGVAVTTGNSLKWKIAGTQAASEIVVVRAVSMGGF